jgi:hypothetical protein
MEMPGLRVTVTQAQRLWGLDRAACDTVLSALVDVEFLIRNRDGAFVRLLALAPRDRMATKGTMKRTAASLCALVVMSVLVSRPS